VKWKDCDESENTWEPIQSFQDEDGTKSQVLLDWETSNPDISEQEQASLDIDRLLEEVQSAARQ
jgi:hypothetical protein